MRGMMVRNAKKEYGLSYQNLLFVSPENGIMKPRAVDAQMICGCEYVGIPLRTMHKIRKTVASDLFDAGVSLTDIAGLPGHRSRNAKRARKPFHKGISGTSEHAGDGT